LKTTATLLAIPGGNSGTKATLLKMKEYVLLSVSDYKIIHFARWLVEDQKQHDFYAEAKIIQNFVRDQIRYVRDPRNIETIQTASKTLEIGQGDCDDKSILVCSLLECLGAKTRLVALAFDGNTHFQHVIAEVLINGKWYAIETTEPVGFEWYPKNVSKRLVVEI